MVCMAIKSLILFQMVCTLGRCIRDCNDLLVPLVLNLIQATTLNEEKYL